MTKSRALALLIAWGCFGLGIACFLLVGAFIWISHPYAIPHIIYVEQPLSHLASGFLFLFFWYLLRTGYRNSPRQWCIFAGKCIMLAFSIVFSFLIGEIGYRAMIFRQRQMNTLEHLKEAQKSGKHISVKSSHPLAMIIEPSPDRNLVYGLQPNLDVDFGHKRVRTNRDGMRDSLDYPLERKPNSVRIVGLGDSGIFGWNVEQDEDYMSVLERNLNAHSHGVLYEVLNMGVPGYNTQLEAENLRAKGLKYKPDIVVVGWCNNDYDLPFFLLEKDNLQRKDISFLYTWLFAREQLSNLLGGFRIKDQRNFDPEKVSTTLVDGTAVAGVARAMQQLKQMCDENKMHLLIFGPMDENVVQVCRDNEIAYYNTFEKLRDSDYPAEWAVHFMHPRPEGHRVLAEHLEKELADRGWLTPTDKK